MRKLIIFLSIFMIVSALSGCGTGNKEETASVGEVNEGDIAVKTGLAVTTSIAKSEEAGKEDGLAQADSVIVAVTVDADGRISNCAIDSAQTRINFSNTGEIITPLDKVFAGKQELGEDYGMIRASSIGKEWNEQAIAFSNYVIGKTVEEIKGISVNEKGVPTDAELTSSVTMHITDYVAGIEKAVTNAEELGAAIGDKLGIGVMTTINMSKESTADEEGLAQAYSNYAVVTLDGEGVITSCIIDSSQSKIRFNQEGEITSNLSIAPKTKNEIGDEYGMKSASVIGKEWYEQADAFAKYVVGKTVDEVKGISLDEGGKPAESELASSVSIHIGPFIEVIEKAYHAAK